MGRGERGDVALVVVGDELLSGRVRDENGPYLAARLRELGREVARIEVVGDRVSEIAESVRRLSARYDLVLVSGGVGPTHDDVTMEGVAAAFGIGLTVESRILDRMRAWGWDPGPSLERLARIPEGSVLLEAGEHLPVVRVRNVMVLPGVPRILRAKFQAVEPLLRRDRPVQETVAYRLARSELEVAGEIAALARAVGSEVRLGSYPKSLRKNDPVLELTLSSRNRHALQRACAALERIFPQAERLGARDGASRVESAGSLGRTAFQTNKEESS